jgi:hypothetical protein
MIYYSFDDLYVLLLLIRGIRYNAMMITILVRASLIT